VHRVLSMVLAYAVSDGRLAVNPAGGVSLPRVREAEKRFLTHRQVHEMAALRVCIGWIFYAAAPWWPNR
jgi:hypothetical protein